MGRYFEDFEIGEEAISAGRTITETDIVNFAALTGDWNEIHTNKELAARGPFKRRIAHGALIFSVATGLSVRMGQTADTVIAFYGLDRLRFVKPVGIGDTIRARLTCKRKVDRQRKDEKDVGQGVVVWDVQVTNQQEELVASYDILTLVVKRT